MIARLAAALAVAAATPAASHAPAGQMMETPYWRVETVDIGLKGNGDFTMPGHVAFARPGSDATADRAEGNTHRGTITLIGNVVVHDTGQAEEAAGTPEYAKGGPSTITCDRLEIDSKARVYTAIGKVDYTQGDRHLTAERARVDRQLHKMVLTGNVRANEGPRQLRASTVNYDTESRAYDMTGAPIVIVQPVPTRAPGASPSPSGSPAPRRKRG